MQLPVVKTGTAGHFVVGHAALQRLHAAAATHGAVVRCFCKSDRRDDESGDGVRYQVDRLTESDLLWTMKMQRNRKYGQ